MEQPYIPYLEIPQELGILPADTVLLASDISRLALGALKKERRFSGADFLHSWVSAVSQGTLLIPAFVSGYLPPYIFSAAETRPQTGKLAAEAMKTGKFSRSSDPFHSFLVAGKDAAEALQCPVSSTFGAASVFGWLSEKRAKMICFDIDLQHSFTFAHYVEEKMHVSYRKFKSYDFRIRDEAGSEKRQTIAYFEKKNGYMIRLNRLQPLLKQHGALEQRMVNGLPVMIIDLAKAEAVISHDIRTHGAGNLVTFEGRLFLKQFIKSLIR